jgi:hypothetical protein
VSEIVGHPGGEQLTQRNLAEGGVLTAQREFGVRQLPAVHCGEAHFSLRRERRRQFGQRAPLTRLELGEPVEWRESPILALRKHQLRTWNPVGALAVQQVPHDVVRAPGLGAFGG